MQSSVNPISNALSAYAQANAQLVETAPESGWVNALAQHAAQNLTYYGGVSPAQEKTLQQYPGLVQSMQQAGNYGGAGGNLIPLSSLKVSGGKVSTPQTSAGVGAYGSQPGAIPGQAGPSSSSSS